MGQQTQNNSNETQDNVSTLPEEKPTTPDNPETGEVNPGPDLIDQVEEELDKDMMVTPETKPEILPIHPEEDGETEDTPESETPDNLEPPILPPETQRPPTSNPEDVEIPPEEETDPEPIVPSPGDEDGILDVPVPEGVKPNREGFVKVAGCWFAVKKTRSGPRLAMNSQMFYMNSKHISHPEDIDITKDGIDHYNIDQCSTIRRNAHLAFDAKAQPFFRTSSFGTIVAFNRLYDMMKFIGYQHEWLSDPALSNKELRIKASVLPSIRTAPPNIDAFMFSIVAQRAFSDLTYRRFIESLEIDKPLTSYYPIRQTYKVNTGGHTKEVVVKFANDYRKTYVGILTIIRALIYLGKFNKGNLAKAIKALMRVPELHILSGVANLDYSIYDGIRETIETLDFQYLKNTMRTERKKKKPKPDEILNTAFVPVIIKSQR